MVHHQRFGDFAVATSLPSRDNLIESPQSGVRMRTRRVCRWRDTAMVERWAAASLLATEKNFRRIMGPKDLWQLEAILGRTAMEPAAVQQEVA